MERERVKRIKNMGKSRLVCEKEKRETMDREKQMVAGREWNRRIRV